MKKLEIPIDLSECDTENYTFNFHDVHPFFIDKLICENIIDDFFNIKNSIKLNKKYLRRPLSCIVFQFLYKKKQLLQNSLFVIPLYAGNRCKNALIVPMFSRTSGLLFQLTELFLTIDHLFSKEKKEFNKLIVECPQKNWQLCHLFSNAGFQLEGVLKNNWNNQYDNENIVLYGIFPEDFFNVKDKLEKKISNLWRKTNIYKKYVIQILSDKTSWINKYLINIVMLWEQLGHKVYWHHNIEKLENADFCFCLSFSQIINSKVRKQFRHTLVVHESDLPHGRGWSPLTWQVINGETIIPITLIEAVDEVDAGPILDQCWLQLKGNELIDELRLLQAEATCNLCLQFIDNYPSSLNKKTEQQGNPTYFPKRVPASSRLDPHQSIAAQFNLLRTVDNLRYPAFFEWQNKLYTLQISANDIK